MDFVAIDFETANSARASACAIGMVKIVKGQVIDSYSSLIKPAESHNWENYWNFNVHGIPFDAYQEAPTFPEIWGDIQAFIGDFPVFAHNSSFDRSVLFRTLESWELDPAAFSFSCSILLAQRILKTKADVSLPALASRFGIPGLKHHDALSDAETCAEIVLALLKIEPSFDFTSLSIIHRKARIQTKLEGDPEFMERAKVHINSSDNGIIGKNFTLTGTISVGTRAQLIGLIEGLGGGFVRKTSKKTNVLVQGIENPNSFVEGHDHSTSYEMAEQLREEGFEIETIFEDQFLELIPGEFFQRGRN